MLKHMQSQFIQLFWASPARLNAHLRFHENKPCWMPTAVWYVIRTQVEDLQDGW
jgi:hypothetical protein